MHTAVISLCFDLRSYKQKLLAALITCLKTHNASGLFSKSGNGVTAKFGSGTNLQMFL